ncbi:MAG: hypothetical protein RIT07_1461, partial [Bacteroidota bacterium]
VAGPQGGINKAKKATLRSFFYAPAVCLSKLGILSTGMAPYGRRTSRGGLNKAKKPRCARFFMRLQSACASTASFWRIKKPTFSGGLFGFVAGTGLEPVTFGL